MAYLVIDTWVFVNAFKGGADSYLLLLTTFSRRDYKIVCDIDGEIEEEYKRYILQMRELKHFFEDAVRKGKFVKKPRIKINIDGFDPADHKFVQVALSVLAPIISGDGDFMKLRNDIKENYDLCCKLSGIDIYTPNEALNKLFLIPTGK